MRHDLQTEEDINAFVIRFYGKLRNDELLGPIFGGRVHNWTAHIERVSRFWSSVLLGNAEYHGTPFVYHIGLDVESEHFQRWLGTFDATIDEMFDGANAEEAKVRARGIARIFNSKMDWMKESGTWKSAPENKDRF